VKRNGFHSEIGHILLSKGNSNLAQTVGAEVKADNYIAFANKADRVSVLVNPDNGLDKLIGYALPV